MDAISLRIYKSGENNCCTAIKHNNYIRYLLKTKLLVLQGMHLCHIAFFSFTYIFEMNDACAARHSETLQKVLFPVNCNKRSGQIVLDSDIFFNVILLHNRSMHVLI